MRKSKIKLLAMVTALLIVANGCSLANTGDNATNEENVTSVDKVTSVEQGDLNTQSDNITNGGVAEKAEVEKLAGEFKEFETKDLQGNPVTAKDVFSGQDLTVINLWGTFCSPCIGEMPDLGELAKEYSDKGVKFVGIPVDAEDDKKIATAIDIVEKTKADYLHLLPSKDLYNIYLKGVTAVPETLFVDKTGTIVKSVKGAKSKSQWKKLIDETYKQVV
ncbi:MAG: TlpA family protein disulfide reductase [Aminipila sp.]